MPIFYKGKERVLFSHIPKTAGSSLYVWFAENGWMISNLKLLKGIGTGENFRRKFEIWQCQLEKKLPKNVSPQHATSDFTSKWGAFSSQFCVVRHPLTRFVSELNYCFTGYCKNKGVIKVDDKVIAEYVKLFVENLIISEYAVNAEVQDNHLRPQTDFINKDMCVLYLEGDWSAWLKKKYRLAGEVEKYNDSAKYIKLEEHISPSLRNMILDFYKKDFDILGYPEDPKYVYAS